jgi:hypothetical protein
MLIHLKSVASFIDTTDALIYAAYSNGNVDHDSARTISECSKTWYDSLSPGDKEVVDLVEKYMQMHLNFLTQAKEN